MSVITEAVVLGATDNQMLTLNSVLRDIDGDRRQKFGKIPEDDCLRHSGGTKGFCETIWLAAFNYLGEDEIMQAVERAWGGPQYGVAIITQKPEGDWQMLVSPHKDEL